MEKIFVLVMLVFLAAVVASMIFKSRSTLTDEETADTEADTTKNFRAIFANLEFQEPDDLNRISFDITHPLYDSSKDD